jgi:hypothetical protein
MFVRPRRPVIHRAVATIATGVNPADRFWRAGNMIGAIEPDTGIIHRVARGTGVNRIANGPHPDTGRPIVGMPIPYWPRIVELVRSAAPVFVGIRTQSWDIALTDQGPVFLELNFWGDLNLAQLANGKGGLRRERSRSSAGVRRSNLTALIECAVRSFVSHTGGMTDSSNGKGATACADRVAREAAARPPQMAPSQPSGYAISGSRRDEEGRGDTPRPRHPRQTRERPAMLDDAELQACREGVNCAAVLERMVAGWQLDRRGSTRRALKYRRDKGEVLIINHDGRGWWDPMSEARGDVFNLVQRLDPSLTFGQVCKVLRGFIGTAPTHPEHVRGPKGRAGDRAPADRWRMRPVLRRGSGAWSYLANRRALPTDVLIRAAVQDAVRSGPYGSAWFAHWQEGVVSHVEIRGPDFKGSLTGGQKTLFRFHGDAPAFRRVVIAEAPIDALSVAALEVHRHNTLYVATGGGMGPGTVQALAEIAAQLASLPDALIESATDANQAGDRYAARHQQLAADAGVPFARLRPPDGLDWNDVLQQGRGR